MSSNESPTESINPYSSMPPPGGTIARLSYERALASAHEHFTGQGPNAPLDEIARDAGIDSESLGRWFPTREHLLVAVSERHIQEIADKSAELTNSLPPGEAVVEWIRFLIDQIMSRRELVAAMFTLQSESGVVFECNRRIGFAATGLLDQAKAAGAFRADVDGRDVAALVAAIAFSTETDAAGEAERFLGLVLDGLQPRMP